MASAPKESTLIGGTLDGKYRIERLIGQGGMGAVFLATHLGTGRLVAVKVILPHFVEDPEALERFRREAKAAGQMRHPNVVDVTDFGVTRVGSHETAYLVMEHLEGQTLRELLERQRELPLDVVVDLVEQIALALNAAHRFGIVHRDLKPDNIWLVPDPRGGFAVRVLDFGIAKLREGSPGSPRAGADAQSHGDLEMRASPPRESSGELTIAGTTLGTPTYMSPEQCLGGAVDARSDIYSLGIVAFEALTGRPPFEGTYDQLVAQHLSGAPPRADRSGAKMRAPVADVVATALAKDPAARQPSATAFAGSLRVAAEGPSLVLRRALTLYVERLEAFLRISLRAARPLWVALPILVAVLLLLHDHPRLASYVTIAFAPLAWGQIVMMSNAAFASAIERLRVRPLEPIRVEEVFADVRDRLGLPPNAGDLRTLGRLVSLYFRSELKAPPGTGDMSFLIAFFERRTPAEAGARCRELSPGVSKAYRWVGFSLLLTLFGVTFLGAIVVFVVVSALHKPWAGTAALVATMVGFSLNAVCLGPIFSTAFPLLYFRARQANGEDVPISAIAPTRL